MNRNLRVFIYQKMPFKTKYKMSGKNNMYILRREYNMVPRKRI